MWWRQDDIPKTAEERDAEIASLIRRRDRMLQRAPMSAISGQLVRGLILLLIPMSSAQGIVAHYQFVDAWVVYGVCGALCLVVLYNSLRFPAMSDRWAMSRSVGYEGDSPQDLQNRIGRIRATQPADRRAEPDGYGFPIGESEPGDVTIEFVEPATEAGHRPTVISPCYRDQPSRDQRAGLGWADFTPEPPFSPARAVVYEDFSSGRAILSGSRLAARTVRRSIEQKPDPALDRCKALTDISTGVMGW